MMTNYPNLPALDRFLLSSGNPLRKKEETQLLMDLAQRFEQDIEDEIDFRVS